MTDQTDPTITRPRRKLENRLTAGVVALFFGYTTREMVLQNDAMTAAMAAALTVGLLWYAVGGLRKA